MIIPIFTSEYTVMRSILTLGKPADEIPFGPRSIFSLCQEYGIQDCFVADSKCTGFVEAYKNAAEAGVNLRFGYKVIVCDDILVKDEASIKNEHKIVVFVKNTQGYYDLIKIATKAAVDGFYYHPRIDFKNLKELWTENLLLVIPFYDSFLHKNSMTFASILPDFSFTVPWFFEESHELPFDPLIQNAIDAFDTEKKYHHIRTHSVYYHKKEDFDAYMTLRCIDKRSSWSRPNLDHNSSATFSLEAWKELNATAGQ